MSSTQPALNDREWSLIMQLLEVEREELPMELRHTDSLSYAGALDERRTLIEDLIKRLRAQGIAS